MCILTDFVVREDTPVYDFTEEMKESGNNDEILIAQGYDNHLLIVRKLDERFKRFDGKLAGYQVEYRELSTPMEAPQSYAYVAYNDFIYKMRKEIKPIVDAVRDGKPVNIFNTLRIFA